MDVKDHRLISGRTKGRAITTTRQVNHPADEFDHIPCFDHVKAHASSQALHASWCWTDELMNWWTDVRWMSFAWLNRNTVFFCMWQYLGNYLYFTSCDSLQAHVNCSQTMKVFKSDILFGRTLAHEQFQFRENVKMLARRCRRWLRL